MQKYIIVYGKYDGMEATAVNLVSAEISRYTGSLPTVAQADDTSADELCGKDAVIVGTLSDNRLLADKYTSVADFDGEGYAVEVAERDGRNVIFIAANEMQGVYYGVVDFISTYLPTVTPTLFPSPNIKGAFDAPSTDLCHRMRSKNACASEIARSGHGDTASSTIGNFSKTCRLSG